MAFQAGKTALYRSYHSPLTVLKKARNFSPAAPEQCYGIVGALLQSPRKVATAMLESFYGSLRKLPKHDGHDARKPPKLRLEWLSVGSFCCLLLVLEQVAYVGEQLLGCRTGRCGSLFLLLLACQLVDGFEHDEDTQRNDDEVNDVL